MSFKIGETVGDYEFLRVVDDVSPTLVYEVRNVVEDRRETLKVLPRELRENRPRVERFLREVKIHAQLSHPNIAEFYEGFQLDGRLVMTMEYVEGTTLEQRLSVGPVEMTEAIDIASQALDALDYAHRQKVVHREIKPANLMLTAGGKVKLTGFGLARQAADPRLTQPGMVLGAAHYMSPEQVKGLEVDGSSDLYSLGIVLYEALTGAKPFDSRSQFDIIQAHVMTPPPDPRDFREDLPEALVGALYRTLEKFPDERFADAAEFREALQQAREAAVAIESEGRPIQVRDPIEELDAQTESEEERPKVVAPPRRRVRREAAAATKTRGRRAAEGSRESDGGNYGSGAEPELAAAAARSGLSAVARAPEGWRMSDLLIVGALTFVMVMALILAGLVFFEL